MKLSREKIEKEKSAQLVSMMSAIPANVDVYKIRLPPCCNLVVTDMSRSLRDGTGQDGTGRDGTGR